MVIIEKNLMEKTHELYNKYCEKGLSFTDCSILAVMKEKNPDQLATTAKEFDGIVSVVELI
jgi:predicted nucleic acid-binding protein